MSDKSSGGDTGRKLPQSEGLVPGSRKGIGTIGGDNTVGNDVGVTVEGPLWCTIVCLITGTVKMETSVNIKSWP